MVFNKTKKKGKRTNSLLITHYFDTDVKSRSKFEFSRRKITPTELSFIPLTTFHKKGIKWTPVSRVKNTEELEAKVMKNG